MISVEKEEDTSNIEDTNREGGGAGGEAKKSASKIKNKQAQKKEFVNFRWSM